ncbi:MAG TPA: hypothetical protein VGR28_05080 [Candidatus Thermoplasmatota archaeon]|nr:hypothetical protein [Candidatus Thermoplasmatota archaeon]
MRGPGLAAVLALLVSGCTTTFPEGSRILADVEVGHLAAGERAVQNFTLDRADFLAVGFRTGPGEHVHIALRGPDGALWDTSAEGAQGPCIVRKPLAGGWALEIWPDAFDGELRGGKFTVRAAQGEPPAVLACANDAFPGRGRNVTLLRLDLNLSANETRTEPFDQPWELASLGVRTRGDGTNVTLELAPPGSDFAPPTNASAPPRGTWRLRAVAAADAANLTVAVQGVGV